MDLDPALCRQHPSAPGSIPPKDGDGKPRVLASSEKPRNDSPKDPRSPGCRHTWTSSIKTFARFLSVLSLTAFRVACSDLAVTLTGSPDAYHKVVDELPTLESGMGRVFFFGSNSALLTLAELVRYPI
jgi:hypothetical protein